MNDERCVNCKFWDTSTTWHNEEFCACRRYPPRPEPLVASLYAFTAEDDWCGEFARKHEEDSK